MSKKIIPFVIVMVGLSSTIIQADITNVSTFSLPGIVQLQYPSNFTVGTDALDKAALEYARRLADKSSINPYLKIEQVTPLLNAYHNHGSDYAHIVAFLLPPEISQEELAAADDNFIYDLRELMIARIAETFKAGGMEVVGKTTGKKETLSNGTECFVLGYAYKQKDGSLLNVVPRHAVGWERVYVYASLDRVGQSVGHGFREGFDPLPSPKG